jgi:DHA2 family multidrug resistance protein
MMLVGPLLAHLDGRYFVALGFTLLGLSNFWLGHLNLTIGIADVGGPNVLSGIGVGMIFVPLTTIANDKLPVSKIPGASGLFNLLRNLGGGVGTAVATTMLSRGAQKHQTFLAGHMNAYNPTFQHYQQTLQGYLEPHLGAQGWLGVAYKTLLQQAAMLSYVDAFNFMAVVSWCCTPLVFLLHRPTHKAAAGGMH